MPDRKIEFKKNVNGVIKIYVDGKELDTHLDPEAMKSYRMNKSKLPPALGQQILDAIKKKLRDDKLTLSNGEVSTIINYAKEQMSM